MAPPTTERRFWHCGAHTAKPESAERRPLPSYCYQNLLSVARGCSGCPFFWPRHIHTHCSRCRQPLAPLALHCCVLCPGKVDTSVFSTIREDISSVLTTAEDPGAVEQRHKAANKRDEGDVPSAASGTRTSSHPSSAYRGAPRSTPLAPPKMNGMLEMCVN